MSYVSIPTEPETTMTALNAAQTAEMAGWASLILKAIEPCYQALPEIAMVGLTEVDCEELENLVDTQEIDQFYLHLALSRMSYRPLEGWSALGIPEREEVATLANNARISLEMMALGAPLHL